MRGPPSIGPPVAPTVRLYCSTASRGPATTGVGGGGPPGAVTDTVFAGVGGGGRAGPTTLAPPSAEDALVTPSLDTGDLDRDGLESVGLPRPDAAAEAARPVGNGRGPFTPRARPHPRPRLRAGRKAPGAEAATLDRCVIIGAMVVSV